MVEKIPKYIILWHVHIIRHSEFSVHMRSFAGTQACLYVWVLPVAAFASPLWLSGLGAEILTVWSFPPLFWLHHATCGILVPQPGIKPMPPSLEAWSPNLWTTRELVCCLVLYRSLLPPTPGPVFSAGFHFLLFYVPWLLRLVVPMHWSDMKLDLTQRWRRYLLWLPVPLG